MSWSFSYPCWNCDKQKGCSDRENIENGVYKAHGTEACDAGTHLGGGEVLMSCCQMNKEPWPKKAEPEADQPDTPDLPF